MKKLFTYVGLIAVLAIILPILSGCSDDKEEQPGYVVCNMSPPIKSVTGVKGTVISTSDGYYIRPIEPVEGYKRTDTLCLILAFKNISDGVRLDLSEYIGQTITFDCEMSLEPIRAIVTIDEKESCEYVYLVQNLIIKDNKSRSGENSDGLFHCGTEFSEESYNFIKGLSLSRSSWNSTIINPKINIYFNILRRPNKEGYVAEEIIPTIMNNLNFYYKDTGITFSSVGYSYLDCLDQNLYYRSQYEDGRKQIFELADHSGIIDIFIVSFHYTNYLKGIANGIPSNALIVYGDNYKNETVAHEIGHCLGLFHTHCCTDREVYPLPHTRVPELVDGSNSAYAGDLITDTPADPNTWKINGEYDDKYRDANNQQYKPDPTNLMSYSQVGYRFTPKQAERMIDVINAKADLFEQSPARTLLDKQHLPANGKLEIRNLQPDDQVEWTVKHASSYTGTPTERKSTSRAYEYSGPYAQYLVATAKITLSDGEVQATKTYVTTGAPEPSMGNLVWESNNTGQYGSTNSQSYGTPLTVSGDTQIRLEYDDPVVGSLADVNFTCVTATRRVLSGRNWTLTKADCANGVLKIRASDGCGSSNDYFTLQTSVPGSYYAVGFTDEAVSFEARTGSGGNTRQLLKKGKAITKIEILNSNGTTVYSATAENSAVVTIPKERLSAGNYTAIIHSGSSKEEIPFAI